MLRSITLRALAVVSFAVLTTWSTYAAADYYGAIAFNQESGAVGYSYDFQTQAGAERRALSECGDDCEVVVWFMNACGALATGDDNGYGTGWAGTRRQAESTALSNCNENSENCSVIQWVCTSR
jgi:Domain of unknown function (DUF4189)